MHARRTAVAVVALAVSALVACSSGGSSIVPASSGDSAASSGADKGVAPDTASPTTSSPAPVSSTPVAPSTPARTRASTPPPGLRDFSDVTYSVPSGFEQNGDYRPLTPLEFDYVSYFLVPTNSTNTKEVIGLYVYTLPPARPVNAKTNQVNLIKFYNARAKAKVSGTIHPATSPIDGLPAYTETATEPGGYTYIAYWAFGTHHFFQFSCQLGSTSGVASLAVACGTTLASLQLN